jgi:hypothetical protein
VPSASALVGSSMSARTMPTGMKLSLFRILPHDWRRLRRLGQTVRAVTKSTSTSCASP